MKKVNNRYLVNIVDGFIYDWNPILAANPKCREVTEEQAYPERFNTGRGRKSKLNLATATIPEAPTGNPDLDKDASRRGFAVAGTAGLPTPRS